MTSATGVCLLRYPHSQREAPKPQRRDFEPTVFYRQFSPFYPPVLTVNPGDTIHTTTVDAGGTDAPPGTGDSGGYGGNMDFNDVAEGATIYLPVSNPGALLYLGDGHALQGDGELNGNALETSMDVEFSVDVLPGKRINGRRIETPENIITMGLAGSLDDAIKEATAQMADWLHQDYNLTPSETAQFLGVAAEYHVSEVADRNAGIVLKIAKTRLSKLTPRQ